jgi:hypothetical protein
MGRRPWNRTGGLLRGSREREISNTQHEQFNNPQADHQHRQSYGIVIEPIPTMYTHGVAPTSCKAGTLW